MLSAHAAWTKASWRTAKSCGPDPPTLGSSLRVTSSQITVANKPGTPRRPRISRKPSRRECRLIWLPCCCLRAQVHFLCTQGSRVRPAPGIPCALSSLRGPRLMHRSGISCRENANVCPMLSLRAKRSNPEISRGSRMDCFVAEPVIGPRVRADPLAPRNDEMAVCQNRRVGKGALAPCPPSASRGNRWARFALPTLPCRVGAPFPMLTASRRRGCRSVRE